MDVLAPGIGGIIGGSQREERPEGLDERMAESGIDQEHHPSLPREWTRVGRVRV
jgi:aspartyl/asparaginyl-tRNA synthetase